MLFRSELSSANEPNGTLQSEEPMDANSNVLEEKEGNEEADGPTDGTTEEVADADDRPDFMNEEDSDEDDFVVTIGEIKANVPFQKQHSRTGGATSGTIDLDANPMLKDGTPIYDLDLATMEDKPWRKPGADITDYFNYGFNEETWNHYCERQRKFRQEFATDQAAINKAILSNIQIVGPPIGLTTFAGGRQLVNLAGGHVESKQQQNKVQKIVVDLSKPPPFVGHSTGNDFPQGNPIPLIRTVISESGIMTRRESTSDLVATYSMEDMDSILHDTKPSPEPSPLAKTPPISLANAAQNIGIIDFSKPPPTFDPAIPPPQTLPVSVSQIMAVPRSQPPPVQVQPAANTTTASMPMAKPTKLAMPTNFDLPPGVEEADGPPGVGALEMPPALPIPRIDFSQPPPTSQFSYNPNPSFGGQPSSTFNAPGLHLQQPFSGGHTRPSPLFQPSFRHPFGSSFGAGRFHDRFKPSRGMSRVEDRSRSPADSDSESGPSHRKRHRSRSRSRSPSPSRRRHKEEKEKHKDRGERKEKDGKKKKEKDKDRDKRSKSVKKDRERESRSIKQERRSSEREKEEKESTSRRRSPETSKRREKEGSEKNLIKIKIERKSPGWD